MSTVYVHLLNEGIDIYRPVEAVVLDESVRLVAPPDYDPEDEEWEFEPGSVVRMEGRALGGEDVSLAVSVVATRAEES